VLIAAASALVIVGVGVVAIPTPPSLAEARESATAADSTLLDRVDEILAVTAKPLDQLVVVEVTINRSDSQAQVAYAQYGADRHTEFEIGSVSKTVTATLFAEAIRRGEVTPGTRVGDVLPLDGAPVADVSLEELASHRSGLPSVPSGVDILIAEARWMLRGTDPYPSDPDAVVEAARTEQLVGRGTVSYSNLGMSLLGQALAAAAGTSYQQLVADRFIAPLGLEETRVPLTIGGLGADPTTGWSSGGQHMDPWTMSSFAPAGGVRSTAADMAIWAEALLRSDAPGMDALEPRFDAGGALGQIGWAWFTTPIDGRDITWHNGMTGGFASMFALDRDAGRAVIVLSNTAASVDDLGFIVLLTGEDER